MSNKLMISFILILLGGLSMPATAHHSINAEFDPANEVTVTGELVEWKLLNPHTYMVLEVMNDAGEPENWTISFGPASKLMRGSGWTKEILQAGEVLTARGRKAREYNGMYMSYLERESGEVIFNSGIQE